MLERNVKKCGETVYSIINYAESLIQKGKLDEAVDVFSHIYHSTGVVHYDDLEALVQALLEKGKENLQELLHRSKADVFVCYFCQSILLGPLTLPCGHTFCKKCLFAIHEEYVSCKKCCAKCKTSDLHNMKTNTTVASILEKFCDNALEATKLRNLGTNCVNEGAFADAIKLYTEAHLLDPSDHLAPGYMSHALLTIGKQDEALIQVEKSIALNPTWPKSFFYKGAALVSAERYEDAILAYLHYLFLDSSDLSCKEELKKLIHKVLMSTADTQLNLRDEEIHRGRELDLCYPASLSKDNFNFQEWKGSEERQIATGRTKLHCLVDAAKLEIEKMKDVDMNSIGRSIFFEDFDKKYVECSLCIRLFLQPVTTPCGHTFCRMCLDRSLDHKSQCPLCKASLAEFIVVRQHATTEFLSVLIQKFLPNEYNERKKVYEEEMEELSSAGKDPEHGVPLFVCTVAYPSIPCPLHVFEPRYRLMTRQCMESGTRQFGMCASQTTEPNGVAPYGTMLNIRDIMYYPDGRSVADTIGGKRFKVLQLSMRDGYNIGSLQFISDVSIPEAEMAGVGALHDSVYKEVTDWFYSLPQEKRSRILQHFGPLPESEGSYLNSENGPNWMWWIIAILPLDVNVQVKLLGMDSLKKRLEALQRVLGYLSRYGPMPVYH